MTEDVELAFEFGYTTPAFRSLFGTNNGIAGQVIARFGSQEQKKTYYRAARLFRLLEGTSEVQRVVIGGALLREAGTPRD